MPKLFEVMDATLSIDPLEFARGALCVASYMAIDQAREVHISSLLDHFRRAGVPSTDTLKTLWFLREAQSLDGGYWIPTPARAIPLANRLCIVAAIQPTDELRRHFPSLQRAGSGRIADADLVASLPSQSLRSWRGSDGITAAVWAKSAIEDALDKLSPSVSEDELELFGAKPRTGKETRWQPVWLRSADGHAFAWRGVGLFRARTGKASYRYFLGKSKNKAAFLEGPPVHEVARMQFGLALLNGRPFHPIIIPARDSATIRLPLSAPTALRRLLVALCDEVSDSYGRSWTCHLPQCVPVLTNALLELSGEVVERE